MASLKVVVSIATIVGALAAVASYVVSSEVHSQNTGTANNNNINSSGTGSVSVIGSQTNTIDSHGLKQETSENPRKELANMGIKWSKDELNAAFNRKDVDAVALFVQGGMADQYQFWPIDTFRLENILTKDFDDRYVNILNKNVFPGDKYCPTPNVNIEKSSGKIKHVWLTEAESKSAEVFPYKPSMYEDVESDNNDNSILTLRNICNRKTVIEAIDKISEIMPYFSTMKSVEKEEINRWRHVRELLSGQKPSW